MEKTRTKVKPFTGTLPKLTFPFNICMEKKIKNQCNYAFKNAWKMPGKMSNCPGTIITHRILENGREEACGPQLIRFTLYLLKKKNV